jgi:hypothetical protein
LAVKRPLLPNRKYRFFFEVFASSGGLVDTTVLRRTTVTRTSATVGTAQTQATVDTTEIREWRPSAGTKKAKDDTVSVVAWTTTTYRDHFDTDLGAVYSARTGYVGLAALLHWYPFQPIRQDEDLRIVANPWRRWAKRINLTTGLSLVKLEDRIPVDHKLTLGSPVFGIGVRKLTPPQAWPHWLRSVVEVPRLNAGVILFSQDDANPLVAKARTKAAGFASVTYDANLTSLLGPLYGLFGLR